MSIPTDFDLAAWRSFRLDSGAHDAAANGISAMEAVAWLAGEPHSDRPACSCPVIGRFVIRLNDAMPDAERQRLLPYLPRLIGTNAPEFYQARGDFLAWQAVTVFTPNALRSAGKIDQADQLQALPLHDFAKARTLLRSCGYSGLWSASASFAASAAADALRSGGGSGGGVGASPQTSSSATAPAAATAASAAAEAAKEPLTPWSPAFAALDSVLAIGPAGPGLTSEVAARVQAYGELLAGKAA